MKSLTAILGSTIRREHIFLLITMLFLSSVFVYNDILWRWDNLLYDTQTSLSSRSVSDDIIIIAIDEESLTELGRWPWSRLVHADLIRKIEIESPRVIGLDIIFNEPDQENPLSDVLLARAMRSSGKVVLPVFMAQKSNQGYPIESLPIPEFTHNAAALGHVHIQTGGDGIVRKVYLKEGIDKPKWYHYSLAILSVANEKDLLSKYLSVEQLSSDYSPVRWSREYPFLIPYAGPPNHFQQIGYSQVLSGNYPKDLFKDKIVLIGATALGLGDIQPVPLPGSKGMAGVEIIANVIDAIRSGIHITRLEMPWLILATCLLVALPLFIYPLLHPANALWVMLSGVLGTVSVALVFLYLFSIWVPLSTILVFQFIGYPLWSWRRLEMSMRHINVELNHLTTMHRSLSIHRQSNYLDEIKFIAQFLDIKGWVLIDRDGENIEKVGSAPVCNIREDALNGWVKDGYRYWARTYYKGQRCKLGFSFSINTMLTDHETRLLDSLLVNSNSDDLAGKNSSYDVLQSKINQVQAAGVEYEELRSIIDDSLTGMAHGVLICSSKGQVLLSNRRAGWYLLGDDSANLNGKPLNKLLKRILLANGKNWSSLLKEMLLDNKRTYSQAQHETGRDLMVEISPLKTINQMFDGFVINFSDISLLKDSERKRSEVLNFLSHDLRSPLASMIAMIELARNKVSIEEMRSLLISMENNTQKTLHLAEQFLQLSRATTSETIKFYDVDFNCIVLNAIDQIWALSNKLNVEIQHHFDRDDLWVYAEADLLERAIVNLLSNAIKHSKQGDVVSISVKFTNSEIECSVTDTGTGISVDEMPYLFEMFMRTKSVGVERKQGIGLGLAFVDAVAKRHLGYVDVESREGEGATFYFRFPYTIKQ